MVLQQKSVESLRIARDLLLDTIQRQSDTVIVSEDGTVVQRKTAPILRKPDEHQCTIYVVSSEGVGG